MFSEFYKLPPRRTAGGCSVRSLGLATETLSVSELVKQVDCRDFDIFLDYFSSKDYLQLEGWPTRWQAHAAHSDVLIQGSRVFVNSLFCSRREGSKAAMLFTAYFLGLGGLLYSCFVDCGFCSEVVVEVCF